MEPTSQPLVLWDTNKGRNMLSLQEARRQTEKEIKLTHMVKGLIISFLFIGTREAGISQLTGEGNANRGQGH